MNNLVRIRIVPEKTIASTGGGSLSSMIITSPRTSITRDISTSTAEVFLSPWYAKNLAIYCDKVLMQKRK